MARILYGVQGITHGHAMRALALARHFKNHEFLFVTCDDAAAILGPEFPYVESLNLTTIYRDYKTDVLATVLKGAKTFAGRWGQLDRLSKVFDEFKPDVCIADYEYFVPTAARKFGVPCLSLDHQHIITCCEHNLPLSLLPDYHLQGSTIRLFFSKVKDYLIISFYQPPVRPGHNAVVAPPILRDSVFEFEPEIGDHVLVYQSCSLFEGFVPFLKTIKRKCIVYGYDQDCVDGNLTFKKFSEKGLLEDLAKAAYVVCGGGHTLMSESLYYGKPILSFPVKTAFEQYINAMYIEKLGYGRHMDMLKLNDRIIPKFEANLDAHRAAVAKGVFRGNEIVFDLVEGFIRDKKLGRPKPAATV